MFDSRKYRPDDPALVAAFLREQRHATLITARPGEPPEASILPFVLLDDDTVELHCVRADATFRAAREHEHVSLLVSDFLAFTPHHWMDPVDGSEGTLHFQAVLLRGTATVSEDPADVANALQRLTESYGHGPELAPIVDDDRYGPQLRRLGVVRIAVTDRQAKFKVGMGTTSQRLDTARRLRARDLPGDGRAADTIERLAPLLARD